VAIVREGEVVDTFSQLMDPGYAIPGFITALTGITTAMVRGQPRPELVMPRLRTVLADLTCIAHNAAFDRRFFVAEMSSAGEEHERRFLCSLMLARRLLPDAPDHKLATLMRHLGCAGRHRLRSHRALDDVLMTCALVRHLLGLIRDRLDGQEVGEELLARVLATPRRQVDAVLETCRAEPREARARG
jgi:DNA polymerase-3 subunit epsilon